MKVSLKQDICVDCKTPNPGGKEHNLVSVMRDGFEVDMMMCDSCLKKYDLVNDDKLVSIIAQG